MEDGGAFEQEESTDYISSFTRFGSSESPKSSLLSDSVPS